MLRNVLITGVSSGIGLGLAREYLGQGVQVFGLSRREPPEFEGRGNFRFERADLRKSEEASQAIGKLLKGADCLDLVILNAGVLGRVADMGEISVEEFREVMEVNLVANKVLIDAVFAQGFPVMQVVAISSGAATKANRGWNAYSISKTALNMMIALYATERPETHFSALAPGIVDTPMQDRISEMPQEGRFSSLDMLRAAKGSPMMPKPDEAAPRLVDGIAKATKFPSGSFLDIHSLVKSPWSVK
jgi:benzil reductase ((S)-benzoin forming)